MSCQRYNFFSKHLSSSLLLPKVKQKHQPVCKKLDTTECCLSSGVCGTRFVNTPLKHPRPAGKK